jgi:hypothetical protein
MLLQTHASISTPNYEFTIKTLENFLPSKPSESLKKENPKFDIIEDNGENKTLRFNFKTKNYSLDIYTQIKKDTIVDTYVRLPQYFNHDLFLKELQTKWKKQDKYFRKDQSAYFVWKNRDQMNILYMGSCSITCFPMFIEFTNLDKNQETFYSKFNKALPILK